MKHWSLQEKLTTGSTGMCGISNYSCVHIFSMYSSHWSPEKQTTVLWGRRPLKLSLKMNEFKNTSNLSRFVKIFRVAQAVELPAVSLKSSAISCRSRRSKGVLSPPPKARQRQFEQHSWHALVCICICCICIMYVNGMHIYCTYILYMYNYAYAGQISCASP